MAPHKVDQRFQIELMLKEGASQAQIKQRLDRIHGNNAFSKSSVQRWCSHFWSGRIQKQNLPKTGAPKKWTAAKIAQVRQIVQTHRCSTLRQISTDVQLSYGCTRRLLKEDLHMRKAPAKWVPHLLTAPERLRRVNLSCASLTLLRRRPNPINCVIAQDESWFFCWDPQAKNMTREWIVPGERRPEKVRIERTVQKVMLVAFIDKSGVVYREFVPRGLGIGAELYLAILQRFMRALRRKRQRLATQNGRTSWVFLQDGAPAHRARDVVRFLRDESVQILPHPGYSPDLNPLDYWFFNRIKAKVRGHRYHNLHQLQEAIDAAINAVPVQEFASAFDRLQDRLCKCIVEQGRYFERD